MTTPTFQHTHWQLPPDGVSAVQGEDDLHQCIRNILSTRKGTDVLRPDFGSEHFDYIDQPFDLAVPNMVREMFVALAKWETRIVVQDILISDTAPHFHFAIRWSVADEITRAIYATELSYAD